MDDGRYGEGESSFPSLLAEYSPAEIQIWNCGDMCLHSTALPVIPTSLLVSLYQRRANIIQEQDLQICTF